MTAYSLSQGEGALHLFCSLAAAKPDHPMFLIEGARLSRKDFVSQVAQCAGMLKELGVKPADTVVLVMPNRIEWVIAFWAAVSLGAMPVPLDPQIGAWELESLLPLIAPRVCIGVQRYRGMETTQALLAIAPKLSKECRVVCLEGGVEDALSFQELFANAEPVPIADRSVTDDAPLMLACTSGSTGNPKILVVPHRGFVRAQVDMANYLGLSEHDRSLMGMPLFHQGGFGMGLQQLLAGGCAVYRSTFDPASFLQTIHDEQISVVQLSPTLAKLLLSVPEILALNLSSWRMTYFAGERLPDDVAARFWRDRAIRVINVIGSSETATMVVWDSETDSARSANEFRALPFTHIRVLDAQNQPSSVGESGVLSVSTDALLFEYLGNATETTMRLTLEGSRRWFDTGDSVTLLEDGRVRFIGRVKRVIKRGPNLVHPEEVEAFLLTHSKIAAIAVGKEPHPLFGESIVAWVQPVAGESLSREELIAFCRGQLSAYKLPDRLVLVAHIPADVGKVQYKRLREQEDVALET